jgi:hypothetical protein
VGVFAESVTQQVPGGCQEVLWIQVSLSPAKRIHDCCYGDQHSSLIISIIIYRLYNAVNNEKDCKPMVINVLEKRPKKIKIIVDMKDVQRGCPVLVSSICNQLSTKHVQAFPARSW